MRETLDYAFNPNQYSVYYYDSDEEFDKEKKKKETKLYHQVVEGLTKDLENLGMEPTYASKILIREVAQNIIVMERFKFIIMFRGVIKRKYKSDEEEVDPAFKEYLPRLQKQINEGLKLLGLLPSQQIEKQKLVIVKKLKEKYENIELERTIKGEISKPRVSKRKLEEIPFFLKEEIKN